MNKHNRETKAVTKKNKIPLPELRDFDVLPDPILLLNEEGIIVSANRHAEILLGYGKDELIQRSFEMLVPSHLKDEWHDLLGRLKDHNGEDNHGFVGMKKGGEEFPMEIRATNTIPLGGHSIILSVRDTTFREELYLEIVHSNKILLEQNKRLTNFMNIISHNLKSYSNNFEAILQLYGNASSDAERTEMFRYLKNLASGFSVTMSHVGEIAEVQNRKDLKMEAIVLKEYIDKTIDILGIQIKSTNTAIHNHVSEKTVLIYNPANIESILLNFLTNAIKYRHPGRDPVIEIDATYKEEDLLLRIKDNGRGINLKKHGDKLFGMYKTFHHNKDAVGVGLFMTKYQVETLGGHISVQSEEGVGTTFTIHFSGKLHP
jgi:PAS domain S-box-containing protein